MLKLRRGVVVSADPLTVRVGEEERDAWADETLVGEVRDGDEVVVNVEARDLGLGSGGFDVVHVNLTRGLEAPGSVGAHVMKLNYTSLQHPVEPVELGEGASEAGRIVDAGADGEGSNPPPVVPVLVVPLHGYLAPVAWAFSKASGGDGRLGYVQSAGGALPGGLSRDVRGLRDRDLLAAHVTAGPAYGGSVEAISLIGGIDAAASSRALDLEAAVVGPGPGIVGSDSRYGHGGMAALDAAQAALALGLPTLLAPRLSSSDPRPRHRGLSHHSATVLELLLGPVRVPVPEAELEGWPLLDAGAPEGGSARAALDSLIEICSGRHDIAVEAIDLDGYVRSGLPARTMGRTIEEDPLFFAAALAAGGALAGALYAPGA
jgi:hypothetical protein